MVENMSEAAVWAVISISNGGWWWAAVSVMYLLAVIVFIWNQGDSSEEE